MLAKKLENDLKKLKIAYDNLSKNLESTNDSKSKYKKLAKHASKELDNYKKKIKSIKLDQDASKKRTSDIQFQLNTLAINGKKVTVVYGNSREKDAKIIVDRLKKAGAIVNTQTRELSVNNSLFYFPGLDKEVVEQIAQLTADIQESEIKYIEQESECFHMYLVDQWIHNMVKWSI